jgi:hypothetical protein
MDGRLAPASTLKTEIDRCQTTGRKVTMAAAVNQYVTVYARCFFENDQQRTKVRRERQAMSDSRFARRVVFRPSGREAAGVSRPSISYSMFSVFLSTLVIKVRG